MPPIAERGAPPACASSPREPAGRRAWRMLEVTARRGAPRPGEAAIEEQAPISWRSSRPARSTTILLTGRPLARARPALPSRAASRGALGRTRLVARGPKPVAALRAWGWSPRSSRSSRTPGGARRRADSAMDLRGRRRRQEYGRSNEALFRARRARRLTRSVPTTRWVLLEDWPPSPASSSASPTVGRHRRLHHGGADRPRPRADAERSRLAARSRSGVIASIGPT
jgi:hypothetical protein